MNSLKKFLAIAIAMIVPFALVGSANAADETVSATTNLKPRSGSFYKEKSVSSDLRIDVDVTTPPSSPLVNPLKNVKIDFPAGMTFNPNNKKTPVCSDAKLSTQSNLADPSGVVNSCKNSVVGTGTAVIILAKINNNPNTVIDDPILVAFNGGKTGKGEPKVKIYGYSKTTNVGILMNGTLKGRVFDVAIPVLSNDSAVRHFDLSYPGPRLVRQDLGIDTRGLDPNFVQARCASSPLVTNATFELGERTYPGGQPTTPTTTVQSPQTEQNCTGLAGKAKLKVQKVAGPNAVKKGRKGAFKVTVRNNGTATAKNVVVTSNRGGKAKAGKIAPGKAKTVTVKVAIRGRKGARVAVKFTAKSGNVKATATKRVRVK